MVFRSCIQSKASEAEENPIECYNQFRENQGLIESEIEDKLKEVVGKMQ